MHDFAVISLSDLMTPLDLIRRRVDCAGQGDLIVCLYHVCFAALESGLLHCFLLYRITPGCNHVFVAYICLRISDNYYAEHIYLGLRGQRYLRNGRHYLSDSGGNEGRY